MQRRTCIMLLAGTASWPLAGIAQQKPMPVIGFLGSFPPVFKAQIELELAAFREGLRKTGYVEGQNVMIVYGKGEGQVDRLPALAADLVGRKVDVIVTQGGDQPIFAAKEATSTIPILFHSGSDPVANGFVASLARPGGTLTGVSLLTEIRQVGRVTLAYQHDSGEAYVAISGEAELIDDCTEVDARFRGSSYDDPAGLVRSSLIAVRVVATHLELHVRG